MRNEQSSQPEAIETLILSISHVQQESQLVKATI